MSSNALKSEGNQFFSRGQYKEAIDKYSEAIKLDPKNAILYANRAQCRLKLNDPENALKDANQAIKLDPNYTKGHFRKCHALNALNRFEECQKAAMAALHTANDGTRQGPVYMEASDLYQRAGACLMPYSQIRYMAIAHDIEAPLHPPDEVLAKKQLVSNPKFFTDPPLKLTVFYANQSKPLDRHYLERNALVNGNIATLLGVRTISADVLFSEDQLAMMKGSPEGVGVGNYHISYEVYRDSQDTKDRYPVANEKASRLLQRPGLRGNVAVMKTTFLKSTSLPISVSQDILCWEFVDEEELLGSFKEKRSEWLRAAGSRQFTTTL